MNLRVDGLAGHPVEDSSRLMPRVVTDRFLGVSLNRCSGVMGNFDCLVNESIAPNR